MIRSLTQVDVAAVAELHRIVFPEGRSTKLGLRYLRASYRWLITEPGFGIGAWEGKKLLGFVAGRPDYYVASQRRALWPHFLLAITTQPWLLANASMRFAMRRRIRRVASVSTHARPKLVLLSIGVSPDATGRGLGTSLIRSFENEARNRGYSQLRLSVFRSNAAARRLYERAGWTGAEDATDSNAMNYTRILEPNVV